MQGISPHSLLKQLSLKDIIRDYFEKEESWDKIFEKEVGIWQTPVKTKLYVLRSSKQKLIGAS